MNWCDFLIGIVFAFIALFVTMYLITSANASKPDADVAEK